MGKSPPQVQIRKFIPELSCEGIRLAELELGAFLKTGIPALDLNRWRRPSCNDLLEGGAGIEVPRGPTRDLIFCYFGTRRSLVGAYLFAYIDVEKREYLSLCAHELPFMSPMFANVELLRGIVVLGQTSPDLRALGRVSGRRSEVFAYILGLSTGLDRSPIRPGDEGRSQIFPVADFAAIARSAFSSDEIVHVSGWSFGKFLRQGFRELSAVMSRKQFEESFGVTGVRWRPRFFKVWK